MSFYGLFMVSVVPLNFTSEPRRIEGKSSRVNFSPVEAIRHGPEFFRSFFIHTYIQKFDGKVFYNVYIIFPRKNAREIKHSVGKKFPSFDPDLVFLVSFVITFFPPRMRSKQAL